ncbi:MAG: prephenate dehydrogenase [Bilifractor sp.]|jgi:prephenate dehydrogenase
MDNHSTDIKRIGLVGLGLIGGSIAKTIRKYSPDTEIVAASRRQSTLDKALKEGIIDRACEKNDPLFSDCDFIFLCAPVQANISSLPGLAGRIRKDCIVTDVGSVKQIMLKAAEKYGLSSQFIGGHPMAGSERTGIANSSVILLENAYYFLTPCADVKEEMVQKLTSLVKLMRAIPIRTSGEMHDYVTASVSHVPHIVASQLVNLVQKRDSDEQLMKMVAAGGFRDITRIASSSPEMWENICLTNPKQISDALDDYIRLLQTAKEAVDSRDGSAIREMFRSSRDYRDSISDTNRGVMPKHYSIYVDIADEAGGIATITTLLAMNGLNIQNIGIIHNREFEEGVLRIEFYDGDSQEKAIHILKQRNYIVRKRT